MLKELRFSPSRPYHVSKNKLKEVGKILFKKPFHRRFSVPRPNIKKMPLGFNPKAFFLQKAKTVKIF